MLGATEDALDFLEQDEDVGASEEFWLQYAKSKLAVKGFTDDQKEDTVIE